MTSPAPPPGEVDVPPVDPAADGRPWSSGLGYCLRVYLAVRVGLFLLGLLAVGLLPQGPRDGIPGWAPVPVRGGWDNLFTAWQRADAQWYLRIATAGYGPDDGSAAFFPLYPLLTRMVSTLTGGHPLLAAYLVSNLALVAALVLLYRLTELELGPRSARRAVLYLCLFPTGFFLFAPYTESLFLALSVGAIYAARRQRWPLAALAGCLAAATRSPGILLTVPLLVEAVLQARESHGAARLRRLSVGAVTTAAVAAGLVAVLGFWHHFADDWRRPIDIQRSGWSKETAWPWETLWGGARVAVQYPGDYPGGYFAVDALVVLVVLAAAIWSVLRLRATYSCYLMATVLFPLFLMWPGRPLLSLPRIYLVAFPLFWALARFGERWRAHDLVVALSAASAAVLGSLFVSSYPFF